MPIAVVCPGCKARFTVSDKFAGKKGPCPKCKKELTVPDAPAAEITVHVPDQFGSAGKDSTGRSVSKPIEREEVEVQPVAVVTIVAASIVVLILAVAARFLFTDKLIPAIIGVVLVSPPLAAAGYSFLRDAEILDTFRGKSLWIRSALCAAAYIALWGAYMPLPANGIITGEAWQWLFVAPVFIGIGGAAALATFDLDYASGCMHYCFYLLVCMLLRFAIGLPPLWALAGST